MHKSILLLIHPVWTGGLLGYGTPHIVFCSCREQIQHNVRIFSYISWNASQLYCGLNVKHIVVLIVVTVCKITSWTEGKFIYWLCGWLSYCGSGCELSIYHYSWIGDWPWSLAYWLEKENHKATHNIYFLYFFVQTSPKSCLFTCDQ